MKIKHRELDIPEDNPFEYCQLEREQYAKILTEIVDTYADGFVLAINNDWGAGKTTFVKMWQQLLKKEGFESVYFNAWESDFDCNPLVAIMSELKTLTSVGNKDAFQSVIEKGAVIAKNIAPALLKAVAKKYIDTDVLVEAIENTTKGVTDVLETEIREYALKKKSVKGFRQELENFIKTSDSPKPLIFIIDELDRCRPDYAVEVLEQMKHFFSVPGIVFVLSIDKNHLASAVRGFYGSDLINTDEYLRRFIDLEYSIPEPSNKAFISYLYKYYSFDEFFTLVKGSGNNDKSSFLGMAGSLFDKGRATLRQQEKIMGLTRLILSSFSTSVFTFPYLVLFLVYVKTMRSELYERIETNLLTFQELSNVFYDSTSPNIGRYNISLIYVEAQLLYFYANCNRDTYNNEELFNEDKNGDISTSVSSRFGNQDGTELTKHFGVFWRSDFYLFKLKVLLDKINLTEPLRM